MVSSTMIASSVIFIRRLPVINLVYIARPLEYGAELTKVIFMLDLTQNYGFFGMASGFNDWLIPLLSNCQAAGIVRNTSDARELIPMQVNLAKALVFDWACANGDFPLLDTMRRQIEILLDLAPEYRSV